MPEDSERHPGDVKALGGHNARWRLKVGDHPAVCTVEDGRLLAWALTMGNRREVYRQVQ